MNRSISVIHLSELEQLHLQLKDLTSQNQHLKLEKQAHLMELNTKAALYESSTKDLHK